VKELPSASTCLGIGICSVFFCSSIFANVIFSEDPGVTTCASTVQGPVPYRQQLVAKHKPRTDRVPDLELNIYVNKFTGTAVDSPLFPVRWAMDKVNRCQRMHDLIDGWSLQLDLFVVRITERNKRVSIVSALLWLKSDFSTRRVEVADKFARRFFISLLTIVDLERGHSM
jgi:hypothetical protein